MRSLLFGIACGVLLPTHESGVEKITLPPHIFTVPEGYDLKCVAGPPLVQRPIHMGFDDDGVLYVTDSSGNTDKPPVQFKDPQYRVIKLVDQDGCGVFDDSRAFAEHLPFPEGLLVHDSAI